MSTAGGQRAVLEEVDLVNQRRADGLISRASNRFRKETRK
jgi:hypothetical protein